MKEKILALVVIMMVGILAGCGNQAAQTTGQGTIDYSPVWAGIKQLSAPLPLTVDLPLSLAQKDGAPAQPRTDLLHLAEIDRIMGDSRHFIMKGLVEA